MATHRNKRKTKRSYHLKPTRIRVKGHDFRVNDLSNEGIGIILESDSPRFHIGERLEDIEIQLLSGPVSLKGTVSHTSKTSVHMICGIRFQFSGDDFKAAVQFKKERTVSDP